VFQNKIPDASAKIFNGKLIPEDLYPKCKECIASCREKYHRFLDDDGTFYEDGFGVNCGFIPRGENYLGPDVKESLMLSDDEWLEANSYKNPALWAERNLLNPTNKEPFSFWPHQRLPAMCTSNRLVLRFGRRAGKSMILAIRILWYIFTGGGGIKDPSTGKLRKNFDVIVLAPQKTHIDGLFKKIRTFLSLSPHLASSVDRDVKGSPQRITFLGPNGQPGSQISGYAAGEGSGRKALGARGEDADLVVVDESAWVSEDVMLGVIGPMLYTHPTSSIVVSSTPSGVPDYFERLCEASRIFKEFYAPATARLDWPQIESEMKKLYGGSQEKWDREVLALFSQAGEGIFRQELINSAGESFEYEDAKPSSEFIYTFGVDWNKSHGTEIVIVGTHKAPPHISKLVYAENIPKKEFTAPLGLDRIVMLNRIWKPEWIEIDEGGGGDSASMLLQFHGKHERHRNKMDARLMKIVESYDFGSKIEIRDFKGKLVKKPAKPFLVENTLHRLETGRIKISQSDVLLHRQLENYIVVRRSPAGIPVFGLKEKKWGDHRLDALFLALIAIRLKFPSMCGEEFSQAPMSPNVGFVPDRDLAKFVDSSSLIRMNDRTVSYTGRGLIQTGNRAGFIRSGGSRTGFTKGNKRSWR
jgi:hypothetical protein